MNFLVHCCSIYLSILSILSIYLLILRSCRVREIVELERVELERANLYEVLQVLVEPGPFYHTNEHLEIPDTDTGWPSITRLSLTRQFL